MTNKEAIVYLEGQWDCMCSEDCQVYIGHIDCPQGFICNDGQALQMAISALRAQDLQQTCNQLATDTISRQAAIDVLGVFTQADALGHTPKQIVEALPSAQPEIVRCKDCKNFRRNIPCVGWVYDGCDELLDEEGNEMPVDENFHCGYAERRTDD